MANNSNFYKIHAFTSGTHTSASGHEVTITKEDLEETAANIKSNFRVPFILGHATHNRPDVLPALGYIRDARVDEDGKFYVLVEANKAGSNLIDGGYCENVSASFYSPDSPLNPFPGKWSARHLASLGAEVPALKQLDPLLEIIPENFSESKNSDKWVSFSEEDKKNSLSFNGTGSVLPDNYEFKTFTKYGSTFRNKINATPKCKTGNKLCNGKCIKNSWTCHNGDRVLDSTNDVSINNGSSTNKKSSTPAPLYNNGPKTLATKTEGSYTKKVVSTNVPVPFDKNAAKEQQVKENLTSGNLKALGALALTLGAEYGSQSVFPDNKQAQLAVKLLTGVASDQLMLKNNANSSQRLQTAFFSGVTKGSEFGLAEVFKDNPYASTHAKATSGLLSVMLMDSGVLDLPFDGYSKKMFAASTAMASAINDTRNYKTKVPSISSSSPIGISDDKPYATISDVEEISKENIAQLLKKINSANDSAAKARKDIRGQKELIDFLLSVMENGSYDDCQNKIKELSKANKRLDEAGRLNYSEYNYEFTDIPITFSHSETCALMQPLALAILKAMGVIDAAITEEKKSKTKLVKTANPNLDAIFSEMNVIKSSTINGQLHDALFSSQPIIKVSESSDFSERPIKARKRKSISEDDNNFSESISEKVPVVREKKLKIDILLDDALSQVIDTYDHSEHNSKRRVIVSTPQEDVPAKKYVRKYESFQEQEKDKKTVFATIDFKETDEYKSLVNELAQVKHSKRIVEIENFTESLYKEGKLTEGIAKKKELTAFLLAMETGSQEFDFGEGIKLSSPYNFMENLLKNIEPIVSFSEIVSNNSTPDIMFQPKFEAGFDIDSQKLDYKISKLMAEDPSLAYIDALKKLL